MAQPQRLGVGQSRRWARARRERAARPSPDRQAPVPADQPLVGEHDGARLLVDGRAPPDPPRLDMAEPVAEGIARQGQPVPPERHPALRRQAPGGIIGFAKRPGHGAHSLSEDRRSAECIGSGGSRKMGFVAGSMLGREVEGCGGVGKGKRNAGTLASERHRTCNPLEFPPDLDMLYDGGGKLCLMSFRRHSAKRTQRI